jgi:hypothetical protein
VRPFGIRDLPGLRRARQVYVPLSYPEVSLYSPLTDLLAAFPYGRRYSRVLLAVEDDRILGLVEVRPEMREYRWVVTGLASMGEATDERNPRRLEIWDGLLRHATYLAGLSGAKRLHAAAPIDGLAAEALRRAGFSAYAQQTLMLAHGLRPPDVREEVVREQDPSDAWSVHQLYHVATPRPIQYAEAFSSNHWNVGRRLPSRVRGFLIDRQQGVAAYCLVTTRGRICALEVLVQPDEVELLSWLVWRSCLLSGVDARSTVWVAVPDYHREYLQHLERMGFQEVGRQTLMVRYAAVTVCVPEARRSSVMAELAERLPARAPSFYAPRHRS